MNNYFPRSRLLLSFLFYLQLTATLPSLYINKLDSGRPFF